MRTMLSALLALTLLVAPAARADMIVDWPDLAVAGEATTSSSVPTEVTFVVSNTGSGAEVIAEPHLVLLDDGIRIPLTIDHYELDGVSHSRFDEVSLPRGSSMRVHVSFHGIRETGAPSWELALSFRGMRAPGTVTIRRG